jgi:hypothetical protein
MCQDNIEAHHHDPYYAYYLRAYAGKPSPTPFPKPEKKDNKEKVQFD